MFGLVKRKELKELKEEIEEKFELTERIQDNIWEEVGPLKSKIIRICQHSIVKEVSEVNGWSGEEENLFECQACEFKFDKKPKGAKILRMKEVLSDKCLNVL